MRSPWAESLMKNIREEFLNTGMSQEQAVDVVDKIQMPPPSEAFPDYTQFDVRESAIDFLRLTNGIGSKALKKFVKDSNRAHMHEPTGLLSVGLARKADIFHEMGHFAEKESPGSVQKYTDWIKSRATGVQERLSKLTGITKYAKTETAYPDNFYNPYVGKVYFGATEVLSMGLEKFTDPAQMLDLWKKDKEHFTLVVDFLKETRNVRSQN